MRSPAIGGNPLQTGELLSPSAADASVRPARSSDAPAIAAVQLRAWTASYPALLPAEALRPDSGEAMAALWHRSLSSPPSARHAALVAASGAAVVGFAALTPSPDPDANTNTEAEVTAFEIDPAHRRAGHGSRLLAAVVDTLRERGFVVVRIWVLVGDEPRTGFLLSAGLRPDGASRSLSLSPDSPTVAQVRLSAHLDPPTG